MYDFEYYDNSAIVPENPVSLKEWFSHAHSQDEINAKLRIGVADRYNDSESEDYHITDTTQADVDSGIFDLVTPYEKEKLKTMKELNDE